MNIMSSNDYDSTYNNQQHILDLRLAADYKNCGKHAPGGVFIVPELDNIRRFSGVIFVRRGLYRNGIFRFTVILPDNYNSLNSHPVIIFDPPIFNVLVEINTGVLDLRLDEGLKEWKPDRHFLSHALSFIKKIFYMKSYDQFEKVPNEEAREIFNNDKEKYLDMMKKTVDDSIKSCYITPSENSTIIFTEPKPAHDEVRANILNKRSSKEDSTTNDTTSEIGMAAALLSERSQKFYDSTNDVEDSADLSLSDL